MQIKLCIYIATLKLLQFLFHQKKRKKLEMPGILKN